MANYIDGFVFPIPTEHLKEYKLVAEKVANIWKEHGAIHYFEYIGDDLKVEGTHSFPACLGAKENETIIFGWVVFDSEETRISANKLVASDERMSDLIKPITAPEKIIFDAKRMAYGGFKSFIK